VGIEYVKELATSQLKKYEQDWGNVYFLEAMFSYQSRYSATKAIDSGFVVPEIHHLFAKWLDYRPPKGSKEQYAKLKELRAATRLAGPRANRERRDESRLVLRENL
jgi:hypothetical protein